MAKKSSKNSKTKNRKKTKVVVNNSKTKKVKTSTPTKKNTNDNIRSTVVVTPTKKTTPKKSTNQSVREKVVVTPKKTTLKNKTKLDKTIPKKEEKVLEEFVPVEEAKEDFETKVNRLIEFEVDDREEISLDDIDVIKFTSKEEKTSLKKKTSNKSKKIKEDISESIDSIKKDEDKNIIKEFEEDLLPNKNFKRKKKGKSYVINVHKTKTYKELEDNLKQLYSKVNDVVQDFDDALELEPDVEEKKKQKEKKKEKTREIIEQVETGEKPSFLDNISQKILNIFLIILFIIFFIMCIAFITFVIYVSTV